MPDGERFKMNPSSPQGRAPRSREAPPPGAPQARALGRRRDEPRPERPSGNAVSDARAVRNPSWRREAATVASHTRGDHARPSRGHRDLPRAPSARSGTRRTSRGDGAGPAGDRNTAVDAGGTRRGSAVRVRRARARDVLAPSRRGAGPAGRDDTRPIAGVQGSRIPHRALDRGAVAPGGRQSTNLELGTTERAADAGRPARVGRNGSPRWTRHSSATKRGPRRPQRS